MKFDKRVKEQVCIISDAKTGEVILSEIITGRLETEQKVFLFATVESIPGTVAKKLKSLSAFHSEKELYIDEKGKPQVFARK